MPWNKAVSGSCTGEVASGQEVSNAEIPGHTPWMAARTFRSTSEVFFGRMAADFSILLEKPVECPAYRQLAGLRLRMPRVKLVVEGTPYRSTCAFRPLAR